MSTAVNAWRNPLLTREDCEALVTPFTKDQVDPQVFAILDELLVCCCRVFEGSHVTMDGVDVILFDADAEDEDADELYRQFVMNGEKRLIMRARGEGFDSGYADGHKKRLEKGCKCELLDMNTASYLADGLVHICTALLRTTMFRLRRKPHDVGWDLQASDVIDALQRNNSLYHLAKRVGFDVEKRVSQSPPTTPTISHEKRLPKVWEFPAADVEDAEHDLEDRAVHMAVHAFRGKWVPGDIVEADFGERSDYVYIVQADNTPMILPDDGAGNGVIPEWAMNMGLQNGFGLDEIKKAYSQCRALLFEYPEHLSELGTRGYLRNDK